MFDLDIQCEQLATSTTRKQRHIWNQLTREGRLWSQCQQAVDDLSILPRVVNSYRYLGRRSVLDAVSDVVSIDRAEAERLWQAARRAVAAAVVALLIRNYRLAGGVERQLLVWAHRAAMPAAIRPPRRRALGGIPQTGEIELLRGLFDALRRERLPPAELSLARAAVLMLLVPKGYASGRATVPLLLMMDDIGTVGTLTLELLEGGSGAFFPSPMMFRRFGADWHTALGETARHICHDTDMDVQWTVQVEGDMVDGASAQAAVEATLRLLYRGSACKSNVTISATVDVAGRLGAVKGLVTPGGDMGPKLTAAKQSHNIDLVVVSHSDYNALLERAVAEFEAGSAKVFAAETIEQACELLVRPLQETRKRAPVLLLRRRQIMRAAFAAAAAALGAAIWGVSGRHDGVAVSSGAFDIPRQRVTHLCLSPDGKRLAVGTYKGGIAEFEIGALGKSAAGTQSWLAEANGEKIGGLAYLSQTRLGYGRERDPIRVVSIADKRRRAARLLSHAVKNAYPLAYSPASGLVAAVKYKVPVLLNRNGNEVMRLTSELVGDIGYLVFSSDGRYLVAARKDHLAQFWDLGPHASERKLQEDVLIQASAVVRGERGVSAYILAVGCYSAPGTFRLALGGDGGDVTLCELEVVPPALSPKTALLPVVPRTAKLGGYKGPVLAVGFTPDGLLATGGEGSGGVDMWNPRSGLSRPTARLPVNGDTVTALAIGKTSQGKSLLAVAYTQGPLVAGGSDDSLLAVFVQTTPGGGWRRLYPRPNES